MWQAGVTPDPQQIVDQILQMPEGTRFQVLAPVVRERKGSSSTCSARCRHKASPGRGGRHDVRLDEVPKLRKQGSTLDLGGRRPTGGQEVRKRRLTDTVETALRLGVGWS